jgi:putative hydrolase of the HAD superfamily
MAQLLDELHRSCKLGLLTDGYIDVQRRKVNALGIRHYFDTIIYSDEWGRDAWKPSLRPFRAVLERLSVPPENAVYVADNPLKDFLGANQIGMATIRTHYTKGDYDRFVPPTPEHAATVDIESYEHLRTTLIQGITA